MPGVLLVTPGDVNRAMGRRTVCGKKVEHDGANHAVPVVPICPARCGILGNAFERASPSATLLSREAQRVLIACEH
jgi:hypothetical protein